MPRDLQTVWRLLEELCPEQHHVVAEDLGDGSDYLWQSAQLMNQTAVKVSVKHAPLFQRKGLMAGRPRWQRKHIP
jgi:hypothetical protein